MAFQSSMQTPSTTFPHAPIMPPGVGQAMDGQVFPNVSLQDFFANTNKLSAANPMALQAPFPSLPEMQLQLFAMLQACARDPRYFFGANFFQPPSGAPPTTASWPLPPQMAFAAAMGLNPGLAAEQRPANPSTHTTPIITTSQSSPQSESTPPAPAPAPTPITSAPQHSPTKPPQTPPAVPPPSSIQHAGPGLKPGRASAFARVSHKRKAPIASTRDEVDKGEAILPTTCAGSPSASTCSTSSAVEVPSASPNSDADRGKGGMVSTPGSHKTRSPAHTSDHDSSPDDEKDHRSAMAPGLRAVLAAAMDVFDGDKDVPAPPAPLAPTPAAHGEHHRQFVCPFAGKQSFVLSVLRDCRSPYLKK